MYNKIIAKKGTPEYTVVGGMGGGAEVHTTRVNGTILKTAQCHCIPTKEDYYHQQSPKGRLYLVTVAKLLGP